MGSGGTRADDGAVTEAHCRTRQCGGVDATAWRNSLSRHHLHFGKKLEQRIGLVRQLGKFETISN